MEQTFTDLYNERRRQGERGLPGFVLWAFLETTAGIAREHILLPSQGEPMNYIFTYPRSAVVISTLLVLPLMVLELVNRGAYQEGFPTPLFGVLWLLPMVFIVVLAPVVQRMRTGESLLAHPTSLILRVIILAVITWLWITILADQMPCFMGVQNCD
jgi:hypothetical protein